MKQTMTVTYTLRRPKHYRCIVDAIFEAFELRPYEILIFRGRALQMLEDGRFRFELPRGRWSRPYRWADSALLALTRRLPPLPLRPRASTEAAIRAAARKRHRTLDLAPA